MDHKVKHKTRYGPLVTSSTSTPVGADRYDWEIHLEAPSTEDISKVEYILHETFPDPVRVRSNPEDGFSLRSNGWGEFDVGVKVHFKDGSTERLRHPLKLFDDA